MAFFPDPQVQPAHQNRPPRDNFRDYMRQPAGGRQDVADRSKAPVPEPFIGTRICSI